MSFLFYEKGLELALGVNQAVKAKISDKKRSCGAFFKCSKERSDAKKVPPSPPKNTVGQSPAVFFYEFGLEPLEKTTALIKRFGESFLAGEVCECK